MEYLVALVAVAVVGYYFWSKKQQQATETQPEVQPAPYKVEAAKVVEFKPEPVVAKVEVAKVEAAPAVAEAKPAKAKKPAAKKAKAPTEKAAAKKAPKLKRSK